MIWFVSGIDTDTGKTVATGLMARFLLERGETVITAKLVQTGCTGISEDILTHREWMGIPEGEEDRQGLSCPYVFPLPASPHLAAEEENCEIDPDVIIRSVKELEKQYKHVILEGAGGLLVPLTRRLLAVDLPAGEGWPLILVTSSRLGSVNHTLLTLEAAKARHMEIAGLVYNLWPGADPAIEEDSRSLFFEKMAEIGKPSAFVTIPRMSVDQAGRAGIDFSPLFGV